LVDPIQENSGDDPPHQSTTLAQDYGLTNNLAVALNLNTDPGGGRPVNRTRDVDARSHALDELADAVRILLTSRE
jgi:hypothetical protein